MSRFLPPFTVAKTYLSEENPLNGEEVFDDRSMAYTEIEDYFHRTARLRPLPFPGWAI